MQLTYRGVRYHQSILDVDRITRENNPLIIDHYHSIRHSVWRSPLTSDLFNPGLVIPSQYQGRTMNLYRQFLSLLLLHPNTPLIPSRHIDTIFHLQIALNQFPQDRIPFAKGFIQHQPCQDLRRIRKVFQETASRFKHFGSEAVEAFLLDGPGACDILYCPEPSS